MRKTVLFSLFLLTCLLVTIPSVAVPTDTGHLVVLMYHRFDAGGSISIPMSKFKRQMEYLKSNNYNFVTLKTVRRHLRGNEPFPPKSVFITIDDGYESTFTRAYPYLKKQKIPWALYVYTRAIEKGYSSSLNWKQVRIMARDGVPVANHTYSHKHPTGDSFRAGDWIEREILGPQAMLESRIDSPVFSFAIPYGEYDTKLVEVLEKQAGYEVVWGIDPGVVDPTSDRYVQPRFGVNGSTSFSEFKKKLQRLPLAVDSLDPPAGTPIRSGDTLTITLKHSDRYRRGPVNVFLSERGTMDWSWNQSGESLLIPIDKPLRTAWNRIIVTAYDREFNRYRYFSKGFPTASE